ncbi:MAG: hypothetical protein Q7R99_01560 [bacterium]|nr:hypothetical protein [bacterium]
MLTITSISTSFVSLFFLLTGTKVYYSWQKEKSPLLKFFSIFLFSFGFQQLFFSLGSGLLSSSSQINVILWAIAHIFMFIGISYFILLPVSLKIPRFEKLIFKVAIVLSIVGIAIIFLNIPNTSTQLLSNNVYLFIVPAMSGAAIGIFTTVCLVFSFVILLIASGKVKDKLFKARALLLAFGVLIFLIGGPMHNFVKGPAMTFLADILIIIGAFLMVLGVYIPKLFAKSNGSN